MESLTSQEKTNLQFDGQISPCRNLFEQEVARYGTPWRALLPKRITESLFIQTQRIRNHEEGNDPELHRGLPHLFYNLINGAVQGLIQIKSGASIPVRLTPEEALAQFDKEIAELKALMMRKNHDYGEAWRDMRIPTFTDLILMKLIRIQQIERNDGKTIISEGIDAGYQDIVNYSIFSLIRMSEEQTA